MLALIIIAVIVVFLLFKIFSTTAGIIGIVVALLLIFGNFLVKMQQRGEDAKLNRSIKKRRTHLQSIPDQIDAKLEAIQASKTEEELDAHMYALMDIMNELDSYGERLLEDAGMTKSTLPQQREYAYQLYDRTLARIQGKKED